MSGWAVGRVHELNMNMCGNFSVFYLFYLSPIDYKFLGIMRKMFPGTPILGLTATATSRVVNDVQKILDIQGCLILKASFNRPNLIYQVTP